MYFIAIDGNFLSIVWEGLAPPFLFDELHRKPFSLPKTVKIVSILLIRLLLRMLSKIHLPSQGKATQSGIQQ